MKAATAKQPTAAVVPASTRFVDNGDGTVTDTTTGLMWSQADVTPKGVPHKKALAACTALDLAGHNDWRLPTVEELFLLADRSRRGPAIDTAAFPTTKSDWYWTNTDSAWSSDFAWVVHFSYGGAGSSHRDANACVGAVRASSAGQ